MIDRQITLVTGGGVRMQGGGMGLTLGYTRNKGIYRLAVSQSGEWQGLTVRAFWHLPGGKDPASTKVEGGYVEIPASVTAQPGDGCITFEGSDGTHTVTSADLRYHVGANSGTDDGTLPEPGTPAWEALVSVVEENANTSKRYADEAKDTLNEVKNAAGEAAEDAAQAAAAKAEAETAKAIEKDKQAALDAVGKARDDAVEEVNAQAAPAAASADEAKQSADRAQKAADSVQQTIEDTLRDYTGGYYRTCDVVLKAEDWKEMEAPVGRYWYVCEVPIEGCDSTLVPMGTLTLEEEKENKNVQIATVLQTVEGAVRFFAAVPPSVDIRALITLFAKGTASMVQASDEEVDRMLDEIIHD